MKLQWLEYDNLKRFPEVSHGTFLRHGGTSEGVFATLNASASVGDHPDRVRENRELMRKSLGLETLLFPDQTHSDTVVRVSKGQKQVHADALFTSEKGVGLAVTHADCQALFFFDPAHQVVGVAHVGWRANAIDLPGKMVQRLKKEVGSDPRELWVAVSPSLAPQCAEFKNYKQEIPEEYWSYQVKPMYFDLWAITRLQLTRAGVSDKRIEWSGLCTHCKGSDWFSYRRDRDTGRHASIIALKS